MRTLAAILFASIVAALAVGTLSSQATKLASAHTVTSAEYEKWKRDLSNWGRWGQDDQIGALNLITAAKRKQAAALVQEGYPVSIAGDADIVKAIDNPNPYELKMLTIGTDQITVNYHGIAHTHLDSLAHINDNGVFYNHGYVIVDFAGADASVAYYQDSDETNPQFTETLGAAAGVAK